MTGCFSEKNENDRSQLFLSYPLYHPHLRVLVGRGDAGSWVSQARPQCKSGGYQRGCATHARAAGRHRPEIEPSHHVVETAATDMKTTTLPAHYLSPMALPNPCWCSDPLSYSWPTVAPAINRTCLNGINQPAPWEAMGHADPSGQLRAPRADNLIPTVASRVEKGQVLPLAVRRRRA